MEPNFFDVIVVGGSFAGLSAALQVARARQRVLVIDAGQPRNRFSTNAHGFLGRDGESPAEILRSGKAELLRYPTVSFVEGKAVHAHRDSDKRFSIALDSGEVYQGDRLILALGVVDRLPEIPGVAEHWGKTVAHCPYCHGYELPAGRWGVLKTFEGSFHQAKLLLDWNDDVIFLTNGYSLSAEERDALTASGIESEEQPIASFTGNNDKISGAKLQNGRMIDLEALFIASQFSIGTSLATQLGCELTDSALGIIIKTDSLKKETSIPGVFAAGDCSRPAHNISWAVADGAAAGIFAHQSLVAARAA
ncbi:MAG: NAD(P)/FAD-dependent oxidoreductase [Cyanobacteria bacterium J06642_2]